MALFVSAYLVGVLTILSPCILPILPFTFAQADRPFRKSGLPLLPGMADSLKIHLMRKSDGYNPGSARASSRSAPGIQPAANGAAPGTHTLARPVSASCRSTSTV